MLTDVLFVPVALSLFIALKGVAKSTTLAVLTGISGLASIAGLSIIVIVDAVLATVWMLLIGFRLYRLSQQ